MPFTPSPRIAVLASGNGSNFEALALAAHEGRMPGRIVALLTDQPGCGAMARAARLQIECVTPPTGRRRTRLDDERSWLAALEFRGIELVLLAGFMRRLHATLLVPYASRVLNIHPSLLPAFPGLDAIGQALAHGARVTGCTVHIVDESVDGGPIVAQRAVAVADDDTPGSLAARVHAAEHLAYPEAVARVVREPWRIEGRRLVFGAGAGASS